MSFWPKRRIQVMRVQAGDVVVYHTDARLSSDEAFRICTRLKLRFPEAEPLFLDSGSHLKIVQRFGLRIGK